ncbi:unnamed protein product [Soboliphyme baturini]|uniref:Arrestin_C domain-containing protein n=1 Tax=Soboliphyme baturini TaxID=241478 RepID=A0A183ISQ3_9BILA|nr:unnamed protein product [Soboliphyme baturini]
MNPEFLNFRYTCKATLERPWDFDIVCKSAFTVIGLQKVDYCENLLKQVLLSESNSKLTFCFLRNSVATAHLKVAETMHVLGDTVVVNVRLENKSKRSLHSSRLVIRQRTRYKAKDFSGNDHYKDSMKEVTALSVPIKSSSGEDDWQEERIVIPSMTPLFKCKIIDIGYQLCYEIDQIISIAAPIVVVVLDRDMRVAEERPKKRIFTRPKLHDIERVSIMRNGAKGGGGFRSHIKLGQFRGKQLVYKPSVLGGNDITDSNECMHYGSSSFTPVYPCIEDIKSPENGTPTAAIVEQSS